jgi:ankyrin repeat protein
MNEEMNIFEACETGDLELIINLVKDDPACVNEKDEFHFTPLHIVASTDLVEVAEFLIDSGANVNAKNLKKITPLHIANYPEMTEFLLNNGADKNALDENGNTPLLILAGEIDGYDSMVVLLEAGADPNIKNNSGESALDIAKSREEDDKVELLESAE